MTRMEELESCLSGLLSTLKKNREHVPLEVLKTQYKQPYEELVRNINLTASAYAKSVLLHRLVLNPDADVEEQCTVINQMIQTSGMLKKISSCMSKTYDVGQIYPLILELRHMVEQALWPYVNQATCLVADLDDIEKEPTIYNFLTHEVMKMIPDSPRNRPALELLVHLTPEQRESVPPANHSMNGGIYHERTTIYPCEKVSFILTYDQLEAAYNIYREQFISCDFIRRSMERLEERIGLCNLPYRTLRDDPSLLHEAYLQFLRLEDCNVAYNDTLEQVIDAIEQWLASGTLSPVNLTVSNQNMGETFGTEVDV